MQALQNVFSFQERPVRVVVKGGEPWFVAKDVCDILEIANSRDAVSRLDDDEKDAVGLTDTIGRQQTMTVISESGLYGLVMNSRKPEAKDFQRWVRKVVIPSIRKHGAYMTPETIEKALTDPDFIIGLATRLKEEQQARITAETKALVLEQRVAEYEPKVTYLDQILQSKDTVTITQIAKDYGMSGQKLNQILNEEGVQYKQNGQWLLYRKHHDKGYTKSYTVDVVHSNGEQTVKMNTRWTQKGRLFIHDLLTKRGIFAMIDRKDIGA
ncbi:phage antirepressor KilAC domain-containing protein [Brevibacillus borstelensis]|uniref:phage antirepressor KilAC domain-containing protein n=1 Tax=Brevibacillus borstelensis TaxID=45462 RepID=UPI0004684713|nr:phage antirepressor [Brevibacillus borstelensis]